MGEPKTKVNDASVTDFLNAVSDETKKNDSFTLLEMFIKVTGEQPKMWHSRYDKLDALLKEGE